ncbi:hypothetical protein DITRI_Ditri06bG0015900 [Diplodiscus trichospermus]
MAMSPKFFPPPAKRPRIIVPSTDFHPPLTTMSPSLYQTASYFLYQNHGLPAPSMVNPVAFPTMHHQPSQGFMVRNPDAVVNVVLPPLVVKPVPVQDFPHQQYGQGFSSLQNQSGQGFAVKPVQVHGFNPHQEPLTSLLEPHATMNVAPKILMPSPVPTHVASVSPKVTLDQLSGAVLSELLQSIMAQGLAKPTEEKLVENVAGPLEFSADWNQVRHESMIGALYDGIPRQCTTCGRRFKTQKEHSKHMDWHVRQNREIKKKNVKPHRPWFFTTSLYFKAVDALTAADNGVPPEVLRQRDSVVQIEKHKEILAVRADEDQKVCALCLEAFEDFYSDETEDWMYKGAVYMKAPHGSIDAGKDRSQLGPIVHAKCLP